MTRSLHNNLTVKSSLPCLPSVEKIRVNHLFLQGEVVCRLWLDEHAGYTVWFYCPEVNFLLTSGHHFLAN
jgi:hypothetical protein